MQKTTLLAATMIVSAVPCFAQTITNMGFTFNTTVGDISLQGEVAYRPNQPIISHMSLSVARIYHELFRSLTIRGSATTARSYPAASVSASQLARALTNAPS